MLPKDRRINAVLSVLLTILCIAWMYPVFMILMNSLKTERAITTSHAFELPNAETFVGISGVATGTSISDLFMAGFREFSSQCNCYVDCKNRRFEPSRKNNHWREKVQAF